VLLAFLRLINPFYRLEKLIMTTAAELLAKVTEANTKIDGLTTQVAKVATEIQGLIDANSGDLDPDLVDAINAQLSKLSTLGTAVQAADDLVPDAPAP
jgi:ABC-type amino acid transport substrate-binding protein